MTLEEEFELLVADVATRRPIPNFAPVFNPGSKYQSPTKTVYSIGEALIQKGQNTNAKLGSGFNRDSKSGN